MANKQINRTIDSYTTYDGYDQHDVAQSNWISYTNSIAIPNESQILAVEIHVEFVPYDSSDGCLSSDLGLYNIEGAASVCLSTSVGAGHKLSDFTLIPLVLGSGGWPVASDLAFFNNNKGKSFSIAFEKYTVTDFFEKQGNPKYDYFSATGWVIFTCSSGKKVYTITENLTNVTSFQNPTTIEEGSGVYLEYTADAGYSLPNTITVTGATLDDWQDDYALISNPTSNVTITIVGEPFSYPVKENLTNVRRDPENPTFVNHGYSYRLAYYIDSQCNIPSINDIKVTGATLDDWYQISGNIYELDLLNVTGPVTITINALKSSYNVTENLTNITADAGNPTSVTPGTDYLFTYYIDPAYEDPKESEVIVTGATISSWDTPIENTYELYLTNITGEVTITIDAKLKNFAITPTLSNVTAALSNINNIDYGSSRTLKFAANSEYTLPSSVYISGASLTSWTLSDDKSQGTLIISNPSGPVTITIKGDIKNYSITNNISLALSHSNNPTKINYQLPATLNYTALPGYQLPDTSGVTVTNATKTSWTLSDDKTTATLVIANPTGNVTITFTPSPIKFDILNNLTNVIAESTNPTEIAFNSTQTLKYTAGDHYNLPSTITVTGVEKYSWDGSTGELILKNPSKAVSVTIKANPKTYNIAYKVSNVTAPTNITSIIYGESKTLTFTAPVGYHINKDELVIDGAESKSWTVNGNTATLVIHNATKNVTIKVYAYINSYSITSRLTNTRAVAGNKTAINHGETITLKYTPDEGYKLPDNKTDISVSGATIDTWNISNNVGLLTISDPTSAVTVTIESKIISYTIINKITNASEGDFNPSEINYGKSATLTYDALTGYTLPASSGVTVTNATKSSWTLSNDKTSATLVIANPTGPVEVSFASNINVYNIIPTLINASGDNNETTINHGASKTLTFKANDGYTLNDTIENLVGASLTSWTLSADKKTGTLKISNATSNVSFRVTTTIIKYPISYSLNCVTNGNLAPTEITYGKQISLNFHADSGYDLPPVVNQNNITNADYVSWGISGNTGTLVIKNPTGPVDISISADSENYTITTDISHVTEGPNNAKFIKFNTSTDLSFVVDEGYNLPASLDTDHFSLTGAEKDFWNITDNTGLLRIKNPTGPVKVKVHAIPIEYFIRNDLLYSKANESNVIKIKRDSTIDLTYHADEGFLLPESNEVKVTNATKSNWVLNSDKSIGTLTISNPVGEVGIKIHSDRIFYSITNKLNYASYYTTNPQQAPQIGFGLSENLTFKAYSGYTLPAADNVTVTNATKTNWVLSDNNTTAVLTISIPTGPVEIKFSADPISYSIQNILGHVSSNQGNATSIKTAETKTLTFSAYTGYNLPEGITVTGAELVNWNITTGEAIITHPTGPVTITINANPKSYPITSVLFKLTEYDSNPSVIYRDGPARLRYKPDEGYLLPTSGIGQSNVTNATFMVWNLQGSGIFAIENPTGPVEIRLRAVPISYQITNTLENITASSLNVSSIDRDSTEELTFTANTGYILPSANEVSVTGVESYSWNQGTGKLTLNNPTTNVSITMQGVPKTYSIYTTLHHTKAGSNPTSIKTAENKTLIFTANTGYNLPSDVTVTGASSKWEIKNGVGTLTISNPSGNVSVTVESNPKVFSITESLSHTTSSGNPTSIKYDGNATLKFTANPGYTLSGSVTVTGATLDSWDPSTGTLKIKVTSMPTSNIVVKVKSDPNKYSITNSLTNAQGIADSNVSYIYRDQTITLYYKANDGYIFDANSQPVVTNATKTNWELTSYNNAYGDLTISNPTGPVTITLGAVQKEFVIETKLSHVNADTGNVSKIKYNDSATLSFTVDNGYLLPSSVSVTNVKTYTWDSTNGILKLSNPTITDITKKVSVTITAKAKRFTISYNNIANVNISSSNTNYIDFNASRILTFTGKSGYDLPSSLDQTNVLNATFISWSVSDNTGTLTIKNPTAAVQIRNIQGIAKTYTITSQLSNVSVKGPTTIKTGESVTLSLSARGNYDLPMQVQLINGTIGLWNRSSNKNAVLQIINPTGNVIITTTEASGLRSIFIGASQPDRICIGKTEITRIYVGQSLIWKLGKIKVDATKKASATFSKLLNKYTFTDIPASAFNFTASISGSGATELIDTSKLAEGKVTVQSGTLYPNPTTVTITLNYSYYE